MNVTQVLHGAMQRGWSLTCKLDERGGLHLESQKLKGPAHGVERWCASAVIDIHQLHSIATGPDADRYLDVTLIKMIREITDDSRCK